MEVDEHDGTVIHFAYDPVTQVSRAPEAESDLPQKFWVVSSVRVEDGVGIVSLNRPEKHNAMDDEMGPELRDALEWAYESSDAEAVAAIVYGPTGDTHDLENRGALLRLARVLVKMPPR